MTRKKVPNLFRYLALIPLLFLGGCSSEHFWLFNPKGPVAATELYYMILDVAVMLVVIVPTILLSIWVVYRYRASSGKGTYSPKWAHSNILEVVVWGVPIIIVAVLAYYSFVGTHAVNPWNPTVITEHPDYKKAKPLEVDVITTDWQWLFVYPKQNIAVSNELVVPVDRPVHFRLTSTSVTNNFFIPQIVGQVYVMPGMRSKQSMLVKHTGVYHGFSAALSGGGFSWMNFKVKAVTEQDFKSWVGIAQQSAAKLSYAEFTKFAKPTVNVGGKVQYFTDVQPGLLVQVIQNVRDGKLRYKTPMFLTENMQSDEFKKHAN
jgi:cytochrome o ubiquinol oxidase subunit II